MKRIERGIEWALWNSRFLTLIAVIASLAGAFAMFFVASVDAVDLWGAVLRYADRGLTDAEHAGLRSEIVARVAASIDGFLFAVVLLIFALGIYELFISKIDAAESSEVAEHVLLIRSLDDLKDRLAKVILLILIVRYFEFALHSDARGPLELLYLALGIGLIALALRLTSHQTPDAAPSRDELH